MTSTLEIVGKNIDVMNTLDGFDVVVVCCSSLYQANYWQSRLTKGKGSIIPTNAVVLAVEEDWPGGAGNALGTLYAFQKAVDLAKSSFSFDITSKLKNGEISVGLFHTAGKGTRLAPLPGAENNNKPGVKLPANIMLDGSSAPITILESVIKQTGSYAKSRLGRLSVFWGDQIFIPTIPIAYNVTHHVDILCSLGPMPSEEEWKAKGLDKYGLIASGISGEGAQVEKVDHATAVQLLSSLGEIKSVGPSLGSFSVSSAILFELLNEFSSELSSKTGKLDTDPHLWMPLTLEKEAYVQLMNQKGVSNDVSSSHYDRMAIFLKNFKSKSEYSNLGLFGAVDVGQGVYWWDYGQLKLYQNNTLLLTEDSVDATLLKKFFGINDANVRNSQLVNVKVDAKSVIESATLGSNNSEGSVSKSVVTNVRARHIEAEGAILVNVTADKIVAKPGSIVYNVVNTDGNGLIVEAGQVLAGVFKSDGTQQVMKSLNSIDGGKAWEIIVEGNPLTFEQVYKNNSDADPAQLEIIANEVHSKAWNNITSR